MTTTTSMKSFAAKPCLPDGLLQVQRQFAKMGLCRGMHTTMRFRGVAAELGCVIIEGAPSKDHCAADGSVHRGYTTTLLESAIGLAVKTRIAQGMNCRKTDLKVTFLQPVALATRIVRAEGTVIHMSNTMAVCEAELIDGEGRLCAIATGTCLLSAAKAPCAVPAMRRRAARS